MTARARSPTGPRAMSESADATQNCFNEPAPESPRASRQPGQVWRATVSSAIKQKPNSQSPYLRRRSMSPIHLLRTRRASEPGRADGTDGANDEHDPHGPLSAGPVLQGGKWIIPPEAVNPTRNDPAAVLTSSVKRTPSSGPDPAKTTAKSVANVKVGRSRSVSRAASIKSADNNEAPSPVVAEPPTPAANRLFPGALADSLQLALNGTDTTKQHQQPGTEDHRDKMLRSPPQPQSQPSQPQVIPETRGPRTTERMISALEMDSLLDRPKPVTASAHLQHRDGHYQLGSNSGMKASASVTVTEVLNAYDTDSVVDPEGWPEDPSMPVGYHQHHHRHPDRITASTQESRHQPVQSQRQFNQSNSSDWTARPFPGGAHHSHTGEARQTHMRDSASTFNPMTSDIDPVATSPTPARAPFQPHPSTSGMLASNHAPTATRPGAASHPAHPYSTHPIPNLSDFDLPSTSQYATDSNLILPGTSESSILASARRRERRLVATVCALKAQLDDHRISNTQLTRQVNTLLSELQAERYARQMAEHTKEVAELRLAEAKRKEEDVGEERRRLEGVWRELERAVGSVRAEVAGQGTGSVGNSRPPSFYAAGEQQQQHVWEHQQQHDAARRQPSAAQQPQCVVEYRPQSSFAGHVSIVGGPGVVNSPPRQQPQQQQSTTQSSISAPPNSTPSATDMHPTYNQAPSAYVTYSSSGAAGTVTVPGPRPAALNHQPQHNDSKYWSTKQERLMLQEQQRLHQHQHQPKQVEAGVRPAAMVQVGSTRLHQEEDERWAQVAALVASARGAGAGRSQEAGNGMGR